MHVLGISGLYHDSAAAVVRDGRVVAAAQEERFTRRKHDPSFPTNAIEWCLQSAEVGHDGIGAVVYYDKPLTTFSRILRSFTAAGTRGLRAVPDVISEWVNRKLWTAYEIEKALRDLGYAVPDPIRFADHHTSHAAAAFYPSPFERAAVLTVDGVGEWATSSVGSGSGRHLQLVEELRFPNSLGLLYSAFTYHAGFKVNSGEYKLMGLAPYGRPRFADAIREHLVEVSPSGSFTLQMEYFDFLAGQRMTSRRFDHLFDGPPRRPESAITQRECDLARSIQEVLEEIVLRMATHAHELTGEHDLVMAGGVALNCVANSRLLADGPFDRIWVQPAAGDAGSALGAALWAWHEVLEHPRTVSDGDGMQGALLGPSFDADEISAELERQGRPHRRISDPDERARVVAGLLADSRVVGMFQGRMEFGPRALGNRSILADPRDPEMQRVLNLKIKQRESFRPFAPAVLAEHADEWFDLRQESPYMLFTAPVRAERREEPAPVDGASIFEQLAAIRSEIPAVTHVDGSARVQTVDRDRAPAFHRLISAFHELTGCPVLVNTSFNVRGEPIVHTPEDAYRCFMTTEMDVLVLEDCVLERSEQPEWTGPMPDLELD